MQNAQVHKLAALIGIEFAHGTEIVPTTVDGQPIRFVSIDVDGLVRIWTNWSTPTFDGEAWIVDDTLDNMPAAELQGVESEFLTAGRYPLAASSLYRIAPRDLCQ